MNQWKTVAAAVLLVAALCSASFGDEDPTGWKSTLDLTLNASQSSYSDNWVGGEQGNVNWVAQANGTFERQLSPKFNSRTTAKLAFGQTHTQYIEVVPQTGETTKKWAKPFKSTDKIDIESVGRFTLGGYVDPYAALRFESQFYDVSVENDKHYVDPMRITLSGGVARKIWQRPEKDALISRLGPALAHRIDKITSDSSHTTTYAGLESVTDFNIVFNERVGLVSKLSLFKALFNSEKDDLEGLPEEDYWKAIDVNFENTVTVAVAKYLQVSLYMQLLYDKEIDLGGRFKETLSLGLTYKLL